MKGAGKGRIFNNRDAMFDGCLAHPQRQGIEALGDANRSAFGTHVIFKGNGKVGRVHNQHRRIFDGS